MHILEINGFTYITQLTDLTGINYITQVTYTEYIIGITFTGDKTDIILIRNISENFAITDIRSKASHSSHPKHHGILIPRTSWSPGVLLLIVVELDSVT